MTHNELLPDGRQVGLLRAEHVDALPAGDLGVQPVLGRDLADDDEALGRHLAAGHARHDREGAVALDVGEEAVVRVLEAVMPRLHDHLVVERRENRGDGGLAELAAGGVRVDSGGLHDRAEVAQALDLDDLEEVGARHLDVDADAAGGKEAMRGRRGGGGGGEKGREGRRVSARRGGAGQRSRPTCW